MASPSAKYSNSARSITSARARVTTVVGAQSTRATTTGINTAAVAIRFQVMKGESREMLPQHYITLGAELMRRIVVCFARLVAYPCGVCKGGLEQSA